MTFARRSPRGAIIAEMGRLSRGDGDVPDSDRAVRAPGDERAAREVREGVDRVDVTLELEDELAAGGVPDADLLGLVAEALVLSRLCGRGGDAVARGEARAVGGGHDGVDAVHHALAGREGEVADV